VTGWEWNFRARSATLAAVITLLGTATTAGAQQLSPAQVQELSSQIQAAGGRVIIQVRPAQGPRLQANGRSAMAEQALAAVQQRLEQQRGLRHARRVNLVPLIFAEVDATQLQALLNDPNVEAVEPDVDMPLAEYRPGSFAESALANLTAESLPWGVDRVTAPQAWALQSPALDGRGIKVAAMDSGGDINHPDLAFAGGFDATTGSTSPAAWNDDISVCNGHGTHVLGTLGALRNDIGVVGVAPGVALYSLKVFRNANGSCLASVSHQITALNWAVQQGIRVVSISIGGSTYVSSYEQAINAAASAGTFVVAAAGNNGTSTLTFPGRYADALGIGATDSNNNRASWSNFGPDLAAVAPGVSIQSTMPGGGYGWKSGTSMATPHAAGVVALILAADPGASRAQVLQRLQSGALDLGEAGRDDQFGYGLVRAAESLNGGGAPPPPPPNPLVLSVSPASRSATAQAGSTTTLADQASVSLTGDGSSTASWSASKRKAWTTLTAASGTGSGTVMWSRNPAGLVAGTYVDTITVTSGSLAARIIDTLVITPAPVPLALAVSPGSRSASAVEGSTTSIADEASVSLTGDGSSTTSWSASKRKAWTTLTTASGTGSGTVRWSRNPTGLAAGTHVDTITVSSGSLTARVIDTLVITAAPAPPPPEPLRLSVTPKGRKVSARAGTNEVIADSGDVILTGSGSGSATWTASRRSAWLTLHTVSGTGSGKIRWSRASVGLTAGTYVDTITVASAGALESPATIIDTLVITPHPGNGGGGGNGNGNARIKPANGKTTSVSNSTLQAVEIIRDSAEVYLDEENAPSFTWTASADQPWLQLARAAGRDGERVTWTRQTEALSPGLHVARISIRLQVGGAEFTVAFADSVIAGVEDPAIVRAAEELFEVNRLDAHQRRLLDQLGNRNGTYDLGDFLAWIERNSLAVPTDLMARVMSLPPTEPRPREPRQDERMRW
jgi:subtilisin